MSRDIVIFVNTVFFSIFVFFLVEHVAKRLIGFWFEQKKKYLEELAANDPGASGKFH